jgi:hypothetical protein
VVKPKQEHVIQMVKRVVEFKRRQNDSRGQIGVQIGGQIGGQTKTRTPTIVFKLYGSIKLVKPKFREWSKLREREIERERERERDRLVPPPGKAGWAFDAWYVCVCVRARACVCVTETEREGERGGGREACVLLCICVYLCVPVPIPQAENLFLWKFIKAFSMDIH